MQHLSVFDVGDGRPPIVILQYPGIDMGDFVLAAPLSPVEAAKPIDVITPRVELDGKAYLLGVHLMASIRKAALRNEVGSLLSYDYQIQRALSRLFSGN